MLLEKSEIMNFLPQREPFLMVDRVVECDASKGIVAELDIPLGKPCLFVRSTGLCVEYG